MKTWAAEEKKFNADSAAGVGHLRKEPPASLLQQRRALDTAVDKLQLGKAEVVIWPIFSMYVNFCISRSPWHSHALDSSHFSLAVIVNPMAWANPSTGDAVTKVYHLCSMGWKLCDVSKDEIVQVLSVVAKRAEWAGRDITQPRSLPEHMDLALIRDRCLWHEVSVRLLKNLRRWLLFTHLPCEGPNPAGWRIVWASDDLQCTCLHAAWLCHARKSCEYKCFSRTEIS